MCVCVCECGSYKAESLLLSLPLVAVTFCSSSSVLSDIHDDRIAKFVSVCVCVFVHVYICVYLSVCMYLFIMCICMYVCMYICMYEYCN